MLSSGLSRRERSGQGAFSSRENEIVGLLQRRLCDKEISSALGISERTVRFHLQNLFQKLGVHDRYSVVEWARATGVEREQGGGIRVGDKGVGETGDGHGGGRQSAAVS